MTPIYWGDIHNHNEIGYAEGTLERSFRLAENSLDFYAFTPHGWWTDVPKDDEGIRRHHEAGFAKVKARWEEVRRTVEERNRPGQFITFPGWEWHSLQWGDHCIYFPDDQAELQYAGSLDELKKLARRTGAILIPHHPGYRLGWRGLDWSSLDPDLSPVVEIFSEHGNSLEPSSPWGMYNHSMGGIDRSQSGLEQLRQGRRFGLIASGDDHYGYPGAFGQGLTAVLADELSRVGVMDALRARHTYAVTGDRIEVDFKVNDGMPGDTVDATDGLSLRAGVAGRDRIRSAELLKNGQHWKRFGPEVWRKDQDDEEHLVRLEWGWDLLSSETVTTWDIRVKTHGAQLTDLSPAFCGGAGSVTEMNILHSDNDRHFRVTSFTSRKNILPTSSVSFLWNGPRSSSITVGVTGRNGESPFSRRLTATKKNAVSRDHHVSAFDRFSSPKLKLHALIPPGERSMELRTTDEAAADGDFYLLKIEQENGQMAWCSPIWVNGGTR
jgi:hypothetical protein